MFARDPILPGIGRYLPLIDRFRLLVFIFGILVVLNQIVMKYFLTCLALGIAFAAGAQTWNPDADFDNVIGVNDLMALLTVFGSEWTAEYPQDPEYDLAAYYAGELDLFDCIDSCRVNNGKVISIRGYSAFRDSIDVAIGHTAAALCGLGYGGQNSYYNSAWFSTSSRFGYGTIKRGGYGYCNSSTVLNVTDLLELSSGHNADNENHCVCAGLVPAVE